MPGRAPVRSPLLVPLLLAGLAAGCTELEDAGEDSPWGGSLGGVSAEEALTDSPGLDYSERTLLAFYGDLRFSPDGPVVASGEGESWPRELVVVDPGERVGVFVEAHSVRLLVYLDRLDLQPTTWGYAWAGLAPGRVAGPGGAAGGLHLPPGVQVHPVSSEAGGTWAELETSLLGTLEIWLDDAAIDEVYVAPEADEGWDPLDDEALVRLPGHVELLDAPSGRSLGLTLPTEGFGVSEAGWVDAELTGEARRGYLPVRLLDELASGGPERTVEIHAWVHEEDVQTEWRFGSSGGSSWGCGGCLGGFGPSAWVPSGTLVFDAEGGEVVGETTRRRAVGLPADPEAWPTLEVGTGWGTVHVQVQPEDVVIDESFGRSWTEEEGWELEG